MIIEKIIVKGIVAELAELLRKEKERFRSTEREPSFDFFHGYERAIIDMEFLCEEIYKDKE